MPGQAQDRSGPVVQLRVVLITDDLEATARFYRDALGLPVEATWEQDGGGVVFTAGRATLEILSAEHAEMVDRIEVGKPLGREVRLALEVPDADTKASELVAAGAELLGGPTDTPWGDRNARVRTPDGTQLTLFTSPPAPK